MIKVISKKRFPIFFTISEHAVKMNYVKQCTCTEKLVFLSLFRVKVRVFHIYQGPKIESKSPTIPLGTHTIVGRVQVIYIAAHYVLTSHIEVVIAWNHRIVVFNILVLLLIFLLLFLFHLDGRNPLRFFFLVNMFLV